MGWKSYDFVLSEEHLKKVKSYSSLNWKWEAAKLMFPSYLGRQLSGSRTRIYYELYKKRIINMLNSMPSNLYKKCKEPLISSFFCSWWLHMQRICYFCQGKTYGDKKESPKGHTNIEKLKTIIVDKDENISNYGYIRTSINILDISNIYPQIF